MRWLERSKSVLKECCSIVAVYERDDGSLYWLPGHIEELRVAKSDFDEARICDVDLQRVEKVYVPEVALDDRRGIFLIRWYVEVDKEGKDLDGYQNARCAGYRLTTDNNGEPFRWMSNYQVLLPVEMVSRPHPACKMYRVNGTDLKRVAERFAAVRGAGGSAGASGGGAPAAQPQPVAAAAAPAAPGAAEPSAAEKQAAAKKATELRNSARAESVARREAARKAQLEAADAAKHSAKRRKP